MPERPFNRVRPIPGTYPQQYEVWLVKHAWEKHEGDNARVRGWHAEANAHLIDGAEELLEACKEVAADVECYCADYVAGSRVCPMHRLAAAIAKAEGRAS